MSKIIIGGAGGAPSENVIKSICQEPEEVVGVGSEPYDLMLSAAKRKYQIPYAGEEGYKEKLFHVFEKERPDFIHFQNDIEIWEISKIRDDISNMGIKVYMPSHETIENCVNKSKSYEIWVKSGLRLPKSMLVHTEKDLKKAFDSLGNNDGSIWLRATVGGGGKGALPTNDYEFAKKWIDRFQGWGNFMAAELLTSDTVTWSSIWFEGELVVAQTRKRRLWNFGNRTLSGVTGITKVGETYSNIIVDRVAEDAILSIDSRPHGIYGVDMTYDKSGFPNPTEINISRFFTTIYFFTEAGLNMPKIYKDIALYKKFPCLEKKKNPLPDGLLWLRGMDREPILATEIQIKQLINRV